MCTRTVAMGVVALVLAAAACEPEEAEVRSPEIAEVEVEGPAGPDSVEVEF